MNAGLVKPPATRLERKPQAAPPTKKDSKADHFRRWVDSLPSETEYTVDNAMLATGTSQKYARELSLLLEKEGAVTSRSTKAVTGGYVRSVKIFIKKEL